MSTQETFFAKLTACLEGSGIPFMISGSLASSFHGRPRASNDLDLVVDPTWQTLERFLASLPGDWYASRQAAQDALQRRGMFNVIDTEGGWKADLIVLKTRPFSNVEFHRRMTANILGRDVSTVTAEDSILSKLEWLRESGSQRQYQDAVGVAVVNGNRLDHAYLRQWAVELGLEKELTQLLQDADRLRSNLSP